MPSVIEGYRNWLDDRGLGKSSAQYIKTVAQWIRNSSRVLGKIRDPGYAPKYRHHLVDCVRSFARYQGDAETIARLADIRLPPSRAIADREPLTDEQSAGVLEAIDGLPRFSDAQRGVLGIMSIRGLRCGDVLGLAQQAIEGALDKGTLTYVGKGGKILRCRIRHFRRYLEMLDGCDWPDDGHVYHLVCPSALDGSARESAGRSIRRAMDTIADELSIERSRLHPHRLRHTHAHAFLDAVRDRPDALVMLRDHLGHSSIAVTQQYVSRNRDNDIAEVEDRLHATEPEL